MADDTLINKLRARGDAPVRVGDVLAGKYRVDRVLGVGGMGVVVAATHTVLHQKVALKFLLGMDQTQWTERFMREARAAVRLKSEHVAKVLDVGTLDSGAPYIVMEFLEGQTLGELLREHEKLPIAEAVGYVLQACEGIAEAHAAGIVHRDLKPDNLFLARRVDGHPLVKILDFGISKSADPTTSGLALTSTHEVVGSPLYMSPEQLRSARDADARSDLWSMGVVLYELLTGEVPFRAEGYSELILRVVEVEPARPSTLREDLPPELEAVILSCLSKLPAGRPANVAELAAALGRFAPESMRDMPQRVQTVLGAKGTGDSSRPAAAATTGDERNSFSGAGTGTAWTETRGRVIKRRVGMTALGALGLGLLLGASLLYRHREPPSAEGLALPPPVETPLVVDPPSAPPTGTTLAADPSPPPALLPVSPKPAEPPKRTASTAKAPPPPPSIAPAAPPSPSPAVPPAPPPPAAQDAGDLVLQRK